jgi:hypothetical protein
MRPITLRRLSTRPRQRLPGSGVPGLARPDASAREIALIGVVAALDALHAACMVEVVATPLERAEDLAPRQRLQIVRWLREATVHDARTGSTEGIDELMSRLNPEEKP